jgi:polysaccharide biosynthesis protein PslG
MSLRVHRPVSLARRLAAVAVLGALALFGLAGAAPDKAQAAPAFGFTDDWNNRHNWMPQSRLMGASVGRIYVSWGAMEQQRGSYHWANIDLAYWTMIASGLRPVLNVVGAPAWARPAGVTCTGCQYPPAPAYDGAWQQFLRLLAARYNGAMAIEIWNEPNLANFFAPKADPVRYTSLLRQAHGAIKSVAPQIAVVSGGLAGTGMAPRNGMADGAFLTAMYRAGAKGAMDAIGHHPYPASHPLVHDMNVTVQRVRDARNAARDNKPIWVTEVGLSTATANLAGHDFVSEAEQASALQTMYCSLAAMPDVPVALVFRFADTGVNNWDGMLGIHRADGSAKPARDALASIVQNPSCSYVYLQLSATPNPAQPGQTITYTASGYSGGGTYHWDLDGNGTFERSSGRNPSVTEFFRRAGSRRATVQVRDGVNLFQARTTVVIGGNQAPVARIDFRPGGTVAPGTLVTLSGARSFDPDFAGRVRNWQWDIVKGSGRSHHYSGRTISYAYPKPGRYRVRLTVTDNFGLKSRRTAYVRVVKGYPNLFLTSARRLGQQVELGVMVHPRAKGKLSVEVRGPSGGRLSLRRQRTRSGWRYFALVPAPASGAQLQGPLRVSVRFRGRRGWLSSAIQRSL